MLWVALFNFMCRCNIRLVRFFFFKAKKIFGIILSTLLSGKLKGKRSGRTDIVRDER